MQFVTIASERKSETIEGDDVNLVLLIYIDTKL